MCPFCCAAIPSTPHLQLHATTLLPSPLFSNQIHREIDGPLKEPILAMLRARGFANVVCVPYDEKTLPGIWLAYATRGQRA